MSGFRLTVSPPTRRTASSPSANPVIKGNFFGLAIDGITDRGNGIDGLLLNATTNAIIGDASGGGNVFSGNADDGLDVFNGNGVEVNTASASASFGNGTSGGRNIISGNTASGIYMFDTGTATLRGNYLGVDATGNAALGNGFSAIVADGVANLTIGGSGAGDGNVLSGNSQSGAYIYNGSTNATVEGNIIGYWSIAGRRPPFTGTTLSEIPQSASICPMTR